MILHNEQKPVQEAAIPAGRQAWRSQASRKPVTTPPNQTPALGIALMLGLDIRAALLATLVDAMLFAADVVSVGALIPVAIAAAAVLGVIVFRIQRSWYGDDSESALIKALAIGLLTAIPVPLTPLLAIPCGALGMIKAIGR